MPTVVVGLQLYLDAFSELSGDRPFSQGCPGPIPFTSIDAYAARYLDPSEFETFRKLIRALDRAYLLDWQDRQPVKES